MKRLVAGLCAAALLTGGAFAVEPADEMTPPPDAGPSETVLTVDYTAAADALYDLGLFQGKGLDASGKPIYDLGASCTRAEAAVMLVRLLGKEEEAKTAPGTPFTDLADWQKPAVNWLYRRGLAAGASYTKFEPEERCTAQMYATFMLRALGYSDQKGDFTYDGAIRFATDIGLIDLFSCDTDDFRRDDAAQMSRIALLLTPKGKTGDLLSDLTEAGVVETEAAKTFRAILQPVADLRRALKKRQPYTGEIFAALREGGDSLSLTGTLTTDDKNTVIAGMLSAALADGRSVSKMVTVVRTMDGVFISPLDGTAYRDDQIARLLRESGILDLMTTEIPEDSLLVSSAQSGNEVTMTLVGGGAATLNLDASGTPALRTFSTSLQEAAYEITVETVESGASVHPSVPSDLKGYIKIHAL